MFLPRRREGREKKKGGCVRDTSHSVKGIQMWRIDGVGQGRWKTIGLLKIQPAGLQREANPSLRRRRCQLCTLKGEQRRERSNMWKQWTLSQHSSLPTGYNYKQESRREKKCACVVSVCAYCQAQRQTPDRLSSDEKCSAACQVNMASFFVRKESPPNITSTRHYVERGSGDIL